MRFDDVIAILNGMKPTVHTDDLSTTIRVAREREAIDFAVEMLGMLENREQHFAKWAMLNCAHVCATCGRNSAHLDHATRCPIEEHYAVPLDGHCHLWEAMKLEDALKFIESLQGNLREQEDRPDERETDSDRR